MSILTKTTDGMKPKKRRIVLWVILLLIAAGAAIGIKFIYDINHPESLFTEAPAATPELPDETQETNAPGTSGPSATPSPTVDPEKYLLSESDLEFMKNRVNILLLGLDESTEREDWGSFRTDTMIVVTIDFDTNNVDLISVPRDSYVKICDSKGKPVLTGNMVTKDGVNYEEEILYGKINSAFPKGGGAQKKGYDYARMTVSRLLGGIPIDYFVGFNMNVVKQVVDAMGGVNYDVDIEVKMNGREVHKGFQHLDGQQVLDYCRQRKGDSDIARIQRQQNMLFAIFRELKSTGQIVNIPTIYQAVEQNIQTNLSFKQISSLALLALNMSEDQLQKHYVTGKGYMVGPSSCWLVNTGKLQELVKDVFGVNMTPDPDIEAANIIAAIEANRAAVAAELAAAESSLTEAKRLRSLYGRMMDAETRKQLDSAIAWAEDSVEQENKQGLIDSTALLNQMNAQISMQYEGASATPGPGPFPTDDPWFPGETQAPTPTPDPGTSEPTPTPVEIF